MTTSPVMKWLADGMPITLLCDLASIADPDSTAINGVERPTNDTIWLEAAQTLAAHHRAASA
jgi:hypothetical protein